MHHGLAQNNQLAGSEVMSVARRDDPQPPIHNLDAGVPTGMVRIHAGTGAERCQDDAQIPFFDQGNGVAVPKLPRRLSVELRQFSGQVEAQ